MTNKEVVRTAFETIWNQGEVERVREFYKEDFLSHQPPTAPAWKPGPDGVVEIVTLLRTAFPDYHEQIEELISSEDKVVARMTNTGTHKGPLHGFQPTGKSFKVPDFAVCRIEHGKIAEQWGLFDLFSMLVQLDLIDFKA